ncbi:MAG: DciA family protein [Corynebacterium sp.]|nr:DciA family protein [Corynebacterium sp.]
MSDFSAQSPSEPVEDVVHAAFMQIRKLSPNPPKLAPAPPARSSRPQTKIVADTGVPVPQIPGFDVSALTKTRRPQRSSMSGLDGRRRRPSLDIPTLGQAVAREIKSRGWQSDLAHGWITGHWSTLVGEKIAQHSRVEKIVDGIVYVSCDNSNWGTQLRYLQTQILRKISQHVGSDVITQLRISGPTQHKNYTGPMWVKPQGSTDTYG